MEIPSFRIASSEIYDAGMNRIRMFRADYSFETNSDGRIALLHDWDAILRQMSIPRHVFMQVDHAYGRMSMRLSRRNFIGSLIGHYLKNGFRVDSDALSWSQACGRIEECECCGSCGGLMFLDEAGRPFMQLNPPSELSPAEWAALLRPIAAPQPFESSQRSGIASESVMLCPEAATDLGISGVSCIELFKKLGEESIETEFTICANGIQLRQSYLIQQLNESGGILECLGKRAGFHVFLPRVLRTAVMYDQGRLTLYLVGPNEQVLFTVRAALNARAEPTFHSVVGL